jgi:hypothetical protein
MIDQIVNRGAIMMHSAALLAQENAFLQANEKKSRRCAGSNRQMAHEGAYLSQRAYS